MATPTSINVNGSSEYTSTSGGNLYRAQQRYSNDCLTQIGKSIVKKKLKATEMTLNNGMGRIDARTYTDVQSNGLAGRIVKYQEKDARVRRSQTTGSLYKRPGHFPLVNLKKTQIPCTVKKKNMSMTRISPPEKSLFYGNTLSSLLRSNSIVCLQKSDEELSCENRPIMHPPPTNETVPTRSVLDVLKEISRKRINSGEEEDTTDFNVKKYCNRDTKEVESSKTNSMQPIYRSSVYNSAYLPNKSPTAQVAVSPHKNAVRNFNNDISSSLSSSLMYTNKRKIYDTPSKQTSPLAEDVIQRLQYQEGKRIKYDIANNAIKQQRLEQTIINPSVSINSTPTTHSQRNVVKQRLTLFNKSAEDTISTSSDLNIEDDNCAGVQFIKPKKGNLLSGTKHPLIQRTIKSKLALMLSGLKGELYQGSDDETDANQKIETTTQPTVTNTTSVETPATVMPILPILPTVSTVPSSNEDKAKTLPTGNKPNFTYTSPINKPAAETAASKSVSVNPNMNATFSFGDLTSGIPQTTKNLATELNVQKTAETTKLQTVSTSSAPVFASGVGNATMNTPTTGSSNIVASSTVVTTATTAANPISTNSFGFGEKPAFSFGVNPNNNNNASKTEAVTPNFSFGVNNTATNNNNTAKIEPIKPNFSFGGNQLNNNTTTSNNNTASKTEAIKPNFNFGGSQLNNNTTTNNNNTAKIEPIKPNFNFGGNQLNNNTATNNNNTAKIEPIKPNFSFGGNQLNNNTTTTNNNVANVQAAKPSFSFGGNQLSNNTTTTNNNVANVEAAKPSFSFGGNQLSNNTTTTYNNVANVEAAKPSFSFGGSQFNNPTATNNNVANVEPAKPTFSFGGNQLSNNTTTTNNNVANVETAKPSFSFGGNQFNNNTSTMTNNNNAKVEAVKPSFSFGGNQLNNNTTTMNNNNNAKVEAVKPSFSFGGNQLNNNNAKIEAVKPSFSFGENTFNNTTINNDHAAKPTFAFGENKNINVPSFTFEANQSTTTNSKPAFSFGSGPNTKSFEFNSQVSAVKPLTTDVNSTTTNNLFGATIKPLQSGTDVSNNLFGAAIKPFTNDANNTNNLFGSAMKPALSTNNLFGSAMAIAQTNTAVPSFNFPTTNATNSNSVTFTPINNNLFAPNAATTNEPMNNLFAPPKSSGPSDRPIRRATRRLNNKQ